MDERDPEEAALDEDGKRRGLRALTHLSRLPRCVNDVPGGLIARLRRGARHYPAARLMIPTASNKANVGGK